MNKVLQVPVIRMIAAALFVGIGLANLLAFVIVTPAVYFAYRMHLRG